ncbi:hypothetical protein F0562_005348 [Nyssa sinensis]|uniref:FYVE-type domain-containing protein n=1 Tax=Nyssa sinensis TaxID=561372 RepID=A0A5J5AKG4_9ASTE|nr:hypothetical protein F0562_005348 [Nyssa sinensis]
MKFSGKMSEELSGAVPSDREVEQAIVSLKKGAHLLKFGRRGKPKLYPFRLSTDEKFLIWYSGQEEKQLKLSLVTKLIRGQRTVNFQRQLQPERECQSFSLIYANGERSLDLICKDKVQADSWFVGLRAVISRCHHPRSFDTLKNQKGAQSCLNSPAGYMRRKHNLGLLEGTTKFSQVRSLSGSPTQSLSERCFSDGLSCSSDSFYSESSLSSMQNARDMLIPNSPYTEPDVLKKRGEVYCSEEIQTKMLSRFVKPAHVSPQKENIVLRDVLIWGEGIGGCLGCVVDKFGNHNGMQLDALLPKLLESTTMLDVQKLSLGGKHAALVTKQGEVFCWGEGKGGRLGHKVNMDVTCPKIVDSLTGIYVKSVACGEYQTCAVTLSGELYTWGDSYYGSGIIREDGNRSQWLPHRLSGPLDGIRISKVACGEWHTAIVSTSGQLFTYGDGTFGVLGHGNVQGISKPKEVESLKGLWVKSVACGPWHTAAIVEIMVDRFKFNDPGGKLFTWGDGDKGRLGHGNQATKLLPTCVVQLVEYNFVQVSCGRMLTVALTNRGIVYTMGSPVHGQLGNPHAKDKLITAVQGKLKDEFVGEISSGSYHIAVLTRTGSVYTWGKGSNGQLGLGDNEDRDAPTLVEALRSRQVESITCGSNSTAAICLHKSISSIDQSACRGCSMVFGFTRKKHNCYNCGLLFCRACSSKKVANASLAPKKSQPFRVCDPCFVQLQRSTHSGRVSKMENLSPRLLLTTQKALNKREDKGGATIKQSQMMSTSKACIEDNQCCEGKTIKNQGENQQPLDPISSSLSMLPRWGQVSCPELFKTDCRESTMAFIPVLQNQLSCVPSDCLQEIPLESNFPISTAMNMDIGLFESDKMLAEEVQKLRAEVESLEKLNQTRREKIQECQQRIEETWLLAKEEAAKCKAAKDVIKALTVKLHTLSEKISAGKEVNDHIGAHLPLMTSIHTDSPILKGMNSMFVATHLPREVGSLEDKNVGSLCSSPIVFSNTLKAMYDRDMNHGNARSAEESSVKRTDSRQNGTKALKLECVEHYEPGVYIHIHNFAKWAERSQASEIQSQKIH